MKLDIIRAWKDETYRQSLSSEQLRALPVNPVGELELTEADLLLVSGRGGAPSSIGGGVPGGGVPSGLGAPGGRVLSGGASGGGAFGGFFGGAMESQFHNSCSFICENAIFSNNNVKHVVHSDVRIFNLCVNFK